MVTKQKNSLNRAGIYNWKCDNPLPIEQRIAYNSKFSQKDITKEVEKLVVQHFNKKPDRLKKVRSTGNHFTYECEVDGKVFFFRADDATVNDNYMVAEEFAIQQVLNKGVPAPTIFKTDVSQTDTSLRYQIMSKVDGVAMNTFYEVGELDLKVVASQLAELMKKIHSVELPGFGPLDTEKLILNQPTNGLMLTNRDFFYTKLDVHLHYLKNVGFISSATCEKIRELFTKHEDSLNIKQGSLVHKDLSLWNIVGEIDHVNGIVDWDDVSVGDPIDDIAIFMCFYQEDFSNPLIESYYNGEKIPENFRERLYIYLIRNMLWKAMYRSFMGYFNNPEKTRLLNTSNKHSLETYTFTKLQQSINLLDSIH